MSNASSNRRLPDNAKLVFKGVIFEVWQWEQKMYDGSTQVFESIKRPDTVIVLAVVGDKILLQKQQQPDVKYWFHSIPGGRVDDGEDAAHAARRELEEESGYTSDDWQLWKSYSPYRKSIWSLHCFIARNCQKAGEPQLDGGEKIEDQLITFEELLALADDPMFTERELVPEFYQMRLDPQKKKEFYKILFNT